MKTGNRRLLHPVVFRAHRETGTAFSLVIATELLLKWLLSSRFASRLRGRSRACEGSEGRTIVRAALRVPIPQQTSSRSTRRLRRVFVVLIAMKDMES